VIYLFEFLNTYIFGPGLSVVILGCGAYFMLLLKGFYILKPRRTLAVLKNKGAGGVSPVLTLCVALAGTLGVGNIAGVASAVAIGGAGAVFWMLVSAFFAIPIKYAEVMLASKHRRTGRDGKPHGGAYYYISDMKIKGRSFAAGLFAVLCLACSLTVGCAMQSNAIAVSSRSAFGFNGAFVGVFLSALVFFVARGGFDRISFVTSRLIVFMSAVYILMSLYIIATNLRMLPEVVGEIFSKAFSTDAAFGGVLGSVMSKAVRMGVTRGIVSNEAGCGTAPIAHASSCCTSAAAQGVFGMIEVFVDTVIICTVTALSVLIAQKHGIPLNTDGMKGAVAAYSRFIPFADVILCLAVWMFAFCTVICWYYYGTESLSYLCSRKAAKRVYFFVYIVSVFLGAVLSAEGIFGICDTVISMMAAINVVVLLYYSREIKAETNAVFLNNKLK